MSARLDSDTMHPLGDACHVFGHEHLFVPSPHAALRAIDTMTEERRTARLLLTCTPKLQQDTKSAALAQKLTISDYCCRAIEKENMLTQIRNEEWKVGDLNPKLKAAAKAFLKELYG